MNSPPVDSSPAPPRLRPFSWKRATVLAAAAVYSPFVVMALVALAFVDCTHCKLAAWRLLPTGPGLFPLELARSALSLQRPDDWLWFADALALAVSSVAVLAQFLRLGRWQRRTAVIFALAVYSFIAFCTLAMIRA